MTSTGQTNRLRGGHWDQQIAIPSALPSINWVTTRNDLIGFRVFRPVRTILGV